MEPAIQQSLQIAVRLRELREKAGLSHEKLSKSLHEKYGIKISSDSLMNYEVSDEHHTKASKNLGMRIEYLLVLSKFYGVSADYILCLDDDPSREPFATKELRLTPKSVQSIKERTDLNSEIRLGVNFFLESYDFFTACRLVGRLIRQRDQKQDVSQFAHYLAAQKAKDTKTAERMISSQIQRDAEKANCCLHGNISVLIGSQNTEYLKYRTLRLLENIVSNAVPLEHEEEK